MNLSDNIALFIKQVGLEYSFGISGIPNLHLLNGLEKKGIKFIQNIYENNSVFFAAGDYLKTSNVNFVIVTAGPGLTNSLNALSTLYIDNIPLVIISINNNTSDYGLGNHHDSSSSTGVNTVSMAKNCTCFSEIVTSEKNAIGLLSKAYFSAKVNSKPAHISIPMDLFNKEVDKEFNFDFYNKVENLSLSFSDTKKPLFIFSDLSLYNKELKEFINNNNIYYCLTSSNKITFNDNKFLGYIDYIDQVKVSKSIGLFNEIILIGDGFNKFYLENVSKYIFDKKITHFGRKIENNLFGIYSNYFYNNIESYNELLSLKLNNYYSDFLSELVEKIDNKLELENKENIYYNFIKYFNNNIKQEESIFISGGKTTEYCFSFLRPKNNNVGIHYIGNFFTLGNSIISLGYSIGSNNMNYVLVGDGDFLMNWNELLTAVNNNINLTVVLFNNGGYKSLKPGFTQRYGEEFINNEIFDSINVGFSGISDSLGLNYYKVDSKKQIDLVMNSLSNVGVNLIEVKL